MSKPLVVGKNSKLTVAKILHKECLGFTVDAGEIQTNKQDALCASGGAASYSDMFRKQWDQRGGRALQLHNSANRDLSAE